MTPDQLYPDKTNEEAAEELALFFNSISQEYPPLTYDAVPVTYSRDLSPISKQDVAKALRECQKSHSKVAGDINSNLYALYPDNFAKPVADIFNCIVDTGKMEGGICDSYPQRRWCT